MSQFSKEIYNSFRRIHGFSFSFLSFVFAMVPIYFDLKETFSIKICIPIIIAFFWIFAILFDFGWHCFQRVTNRTPKVIRGITPIAPYKNQAVATLLLEASDLFGTDSVVSVYRRDDDYERFIGSGFVTTVQDNKLIQICITDGEESAADVWGKITNNDATELRKLIVKPSVPRSLLIAA
jgi:hypothetical protein